MIRIGSVYDVSDVGDAALDAGWSGASSTPAWPQVPQQRVSVESLSTSS